MTQPDRTSFPAPPKPPRRGGARPLGMRFVAPQAEFAPIAAINTTPLVDVMLVLLVMFIIIIPVASHKVPLDLPRPDDRTVPVPPPVHRLAIAASGRLSWDGAPVAAAALPARLAALAADPARPVLHLDADGAARYGEVNRILAEIGRAGVTRMGFVDSQRFARAF